MWYAGIHCAFSLFLEVQTVQFLEQIVEKIFIDMLHLYGTDMGR